MAAATTRRRASSGQTSGEKESMRLVSSGRYRSWPDEITTARPIDKDFNDSWEVRGRRQFSQNADRRATGPKMDAIEVARKSRRPEFPPRVATARSRDQSLPSTHK